MIKGPARLQRFENSDVTYERETQETEHVTGGRINVQRKKKESTASLLEIKTVTERQWPVVATLSSNAVQPGPPKVHEEQHILSMALPVAHVGP